MTWGILCAVDSEIALLKEAMQVEQTDTMLSRTFWKGKLYGCDVVLCKAMIGKVAAAVTATVMLQQYGVDALVFMGTAGGIAPAMQVGDLVVADACLQYDMDVPMDGQFVIPGLGKAYLPADKALADSLFAAAEDFIREDYFSCAEETHYRTFGIQSPKVTRGTVTSGDTFICTNEKKDWLYRSIDGVQCTDMESAAVAQVCAEADCPYAILRVISDCASDEAQIDYNAFVEHMSTRLLGGMAKRLFTRLATN